MSDEQVPESPPEWRANYIAAPHFYELSAYTLNRALGGFGCYLVGSALVTKDYRDVDVRFILSGAEYAEWFKGEGRLDGRPVDGDVRVDLGLALEENGAPDRLPDPAADACERDPPAWEAIRARHLPGLPGERPTDSATE